MLDSLDYEIMKLQKKIKEKNKDKKKNKGTIEINNESDNLSIDNSNESSSNKKSNIKTRNFLSNDNLLDEIEDNQTNKIINSEKKVIDEKKVELFKLLVEAKKKQNQIFDEPIDKKLNNKVDDKLSDSELSTQITINSNSNNRLINNDSSNDDDSDKSMKLVFINKPTNIYIDSDSENNIRLREYDKKPNKYQAIEINQQLSNLIDKKENFGSKTKNVSIIKKINNSNNHTPNYSSSANLCVVSNLVTERECYNDYMIKLSEPIRLKDLNINNILLPKRNTENISENNNELQVEINSVKKTIELNPDYYNRNEIVECLNDCFKAYELEINSYINSDDKFIFESKLGEKFKLISSNKSILPYLGFGKNTYISKNKYDAENPLDIGDNIFYLVIGNICSEPMFRIDMDSDEPYIEKLLELDSDIEIDRLYIQFYKTKNCLIKNDSEYSFFFESEHEIDFEFI